MKKVYVTDEAHAEAKAAAALAGLEMREWTSAAILAIARQQRKSREEESRQERRAAS